jgi:hypothetical protein
MSIGAKPWEGGGAASVPDASETTKGIIRIATSGEASTGTDDLTAMTPLTVKERIDAALVGGVEYKGTFNATTGLPSLANAEQGDLYYIATGGTIYGKTWSVSDHLIINANMGGTIDNAKIDKVDNTNEDASETVKGVVQLATDAEAQAASVSTKALVPSNIGSIDVGDLNDDGTYLKNLIEDTTPELGGDLITNGFAITSSGSENVTIDPDGLGVISVGADLMPDADATHYIGDENTRFISAYTDINGAIRFKAKNDQGASITKGQAVYIKGVSGTVPTVGLARADSASTMPAFGLALENANDQAEVQIITFGNLTDVNTTTYSLSANQTVYVSAATAGALTNTAPSGESNLIQNIGRVVRADASAGIIKVGGAGRSNATPNLNDGKIFLGNASNQAVSTALSAINLSSFNNDLSGLGNQINALQVKTSASYTAQANYVYIGGYTSGTQTITMPAASGATSGDIIGFTSNVAPRALSLVSSDGTTNDIVNQSNQAKGGSNGALSLTVNQQISWFIHNGSSWYEANAALASVATSGAYSDLSGTPTLATVATTGAYSDLSGTPTLATVATTGAYSDLSGTPTLGTAAALDVGTSASNVVQLDGSARLPAVDGSQLTNLPSGATALDDLTDVTITAASTGEVLRYNGASWVDATLAYSDLSGTPTLATVATTGAYSDLSGTPTLATVATTGAYSDLSGTPTLGTAAALDVGTSASNVVQLDGSARLPAVDGSQLTNLPSGASALGDLTDVTITAAATGEVLRYNGASWVDATLAYSDLSGTPTLATVATTGAYSDLSGTPTLATVATTGAYSDLSGTPTLGTAAALDVGTSASNVVQLDGSARLPAVDGSQLTNLPSGATQLNDLSDVTITGAATGEVLRYNGAAWVDAQLAYSDLSGTPTLGTAAALDVGTSASNVVQLDGSARLPAVDGSQLTNLPSGGGGFTYSAITSATNAQVDYHYSCGAGNQTFTVSLPDASSSSGRVSIKNVGTGTITIGRVTGTDTIDGAASNYVISAQNTAITLISNETDGWEIM